MIICDAQQGTEQWHRDRAGVITASMFVEVRKQLKSGPNKGDLTAAAKNYAFRLAIERISGEPLMDGGFDTWAMRRGRELEPEARMLHEQRLGTMIEAVSFIHTDDGNYGASADGFIGEEGGAEYKCLVSPDRLRTIIIDQDLAQFNDQIQGCMWITGRKWWHFGLYCPALGSAGKELIIHEVLRDDNYIEELEQDLYKFNKLVETNRTQILAADSGLDLVQETNNEAAGIFQ